jgi:hypothetical protein
MDEDTCWKECACESAEMRGENRHEETNIGIYFCGLSFSEKICGAETKIDTNA